MRIKRNIDLPRRREEFKDFVEVLDYLTSRQKAEEFIFRDLIDAINVNEGSAIDQTNDTALPTASAEMRGRFLFVEDYDGAGTGDVLFWCYYDGAAYAWFRIGPP